MAYNPNTVLSFRSQYRQGISHWYNPWLHASFVISVAIASIVFWLNQLENVSLWQWSAVPLTLVFFSWGEYHVHRHLGHHKTHLGKLFYQRHTRDHHSFFIESKMSYEGAQDWRVIMFPAWLIVLYSLPLWAFWWLFKDLHANLAALIPCSMLLGYLSYEVLHICQHLPNQHPLSRLPWIRHMRHLHSLHHRRDLMHKRNFGIVHPLMDWLYGTLHWEPVSKQQD